MLTVITIQIYIWIEKKQHTVQYLAGLEIKPVRTVLKSSGIHRLLVSFRAYLMTYNFQTFFLPQYIKLCKVFMSILFNF